MAHHEVISRSGNAFLLNIRESVLLPGSMSEMHFFLLIGISSIHSAYSTLFDHGLASK
ncbi:hypothetical protein KK608_005177, partial [Escherichia coli]|nr:hypothetical protein [Escherichia coli]